MCVCVVVVDDDDDDGDVEIREKEDGLIFCMYYYLRFPFFSPTTLSFPHGSHR